MNTDKATTQLQAAGGQENVNKAIRLSAKMLEVRDFYKRMSGSKYEENIAEVIEMIKAVAQHHKATVMEASLMMTRQASDGIHPMTVALITAGTVEMIERGQS